MKVLHLVLKRKWYDMIVSGEKIEEYREIKPYWSNRLFKGFTHVCFHLGYTNQTMLFAIKEIIEYTGKEEWGAEKGKIYYVIKLGKEVRNENNQIQR